jgi:hypothetical protein
VSVATTLRSGRYIVEVISTTNRKGNVFISFDKGKIASMIHNLRQIYEMSTHNLHSVQSSELSCVMAALSSLRVLD